MQESKRFWSKVVFTRDCWLWNGNILRSGYGQFAITHNHMILAHRYAYEILVGPIPNGLWVLHKCDVRNCINPQHLFLGDNHDNQIDSRNKGRHGRQKLKIKDIPNIRKLINKGIKQVIANKYGVGHRLISQIKNEHRWAGVF